MAVRRPLQDGHHVMRYVPRSKQFIDDNQNSLGPAPAAFAIREEDEGGLSVTEVEHFGEMNAQTRAVAAAAHRASLESKRLAPSAIFAWAPIGAVKAAANDYGKAVRVVHDPVDGNPGHAQIRHFTDDDLDLLEYFATDVFHEFARVGTMGIPPHAG